MILAHRAEVRAWTSWSDWLQYWWTVEMLEVPSNERLRVFLELWPPTSFHFHTIKSPHPYGELFSSLDANLMPFQTCGTLSPYFIRGSFSSAAVWMAMWWSPYCLLYVSYLYLRQDPPIALVVLGRCLTKAVKPTGGCPQDTLSMCRAVAS